MTRLASLEATSGRARARARPLAVLRACAAVAACSGPSARDVVVPTAPSARSAAVVSGRVSSRAGAPMDSVAVLVRSAAGEERFYGGAVTTAEDGTFRILVLRPAATTDRQRAAHGFVVAFTLAPKYAMRGRAPAALDSVAVAIHFEPRGSTPPPVTRTEITLAVP